MGKNREGAVYTSLPQKLIRKQTSESVDKKKTFKTLPKRLQVDHQNFVFLYVILWGAYLVECPPKAVNPT